MAAFYTTTTPLSPNSPTPLYPVFGYTLDDDCEPAAHGQGEQLGLAANVDFSAIPLLNEPSSLRSQSLSTHVPPPSIHIQPSADPGHPQPPTGRGNPSSSTTFDTNNHNPDIQPYVTPVEGIRPVYFEPFAQGRGKDGTAPSGGLVCGLQDETKIDILTDLFRSVFHRSSPSCNTTTTAKNASETPDNTKSNSSTNNIDLDGDHQNRQAPVGILCFTAEDGTKGILEAVDRALGGSTSSTQNVQESFLGAEIIVLTPTANVARLKDLCSAYPEVKVYPLLVHLNDIEIDHVRHLLLLNRDGVSPYQQEVAHGITVFDACGFLSTNYMVSSPSGAYESAVHSLSEKYLLTKAPIDSSCGGENHTPSPQNWVNWLREGQKPPPATHTAKGPKLARPNPVPQSRNQAKASSSISQQPDTPLSGSPSPSSDKPFILCVDWTGMPTDAHHMRNLLGDIVLKNWLQYCHPTDETTGKPTATTINSLIVCDNAEHYLSVDMEGPFSKSVVQLLTSTGALYRRSAVSGQPVGHISMLTTQGELVDMDHPCQTWPQPSKTFPVSEAGGAKGPSTHLVVLSQSPTKLSTDILDRLSYVILHRFTAPRWLHFLGNHFHLTISQSKAPKHSAALLMERITKLEEDEVLVYSSFIKHPVKKGQQELGGRPIKLKLQSGLDAGQLGTIVLQYHAKKSQQRASSKQATAATSVTNTSHLSGRPNNGLATDEDPSLRSYSPFLSQRLGLSKALDISQNEDMRRNQGSRGEHRQLAPLTSGTQQLVDPTTEYASRTARPWITQTMSNSISTASDATAIPAQIGGIHPSGSTTSTHGFNTSRANGHIGNTYDNQTWDHTLPPSGSSLLSPSSTVGDTSRFSKPSAFMQIGSAAATSLGISPGGIRPHISPSNGFPSRMQTSGGNFPPSPGMSSFTGGPSSPSYFHTPGFTGVSISPGRPGSGNPNTFSPFLNTSGLSNDDPIMRGNGRDVRLTHATDNSYSAYSQKQQPISSSSETGAFQIPSATSFSSDSQSRSRADTSTDSSSAEFVDIGEGISFKSKADVGVIGGGVPGANNSKGIMENQSPTAARNGGSGYGLGSLVSPKKSYAVVTAPGRSNGPLTSRQDTIIAPASQINTATPSTLLPNPLSHGEGLGRTLSKDPSHSHVPGTLSMSSVDSITQRQYQSHLQQSANQLVVPPPNYPDSFFWPLLDALEKARAQVSTPHNRAQSVRHSVVGQELPPAARTRIGLTFKEYVAAAARAGVIVTGDSGDKAWIALKDWKYPGKSQGVYASQAPGSGTKIIIR
ncbi:hypothetical protein CPB86DRAFT_790810 [Serendipita vermifera]|nr:hypothetical protein CPB86DRAFT_790810 [Serendipita vermifera]